MVDDSKVLALPQRLRQLSDDELTPEQKNLINKIKGFSLNGMRGPFNMMLRSPEAAERFQHLGEYLRFDTDLGNRLVELLVLIHARIFHDQYEWYLHAPRALEAGLSKHIIEDIKQGKKPSFINEDEAALFNYVLELSLTRNVSDETLESAVNVLGERNVANIVFMLGQYTTISLFLSVLGEGRELDVLPACLDPFKVNSESNPS